MRIPETAARIWSDGRFLYLATREAKYKFQLSSEGMAQAVEQIALRQWEPEIKQAVPVHNNHPIKYSLRGKKVVSLTQGEKEMAEAVLRKVGLIP